MQIIRLLFIVFALLWLIPNVSAKEIEQVRIFKFDTPNDVTRRYFIDVLKLTLKKASPNKSIAIEEIPAKDNINNSWGLYLNQDYIDIIWAGTNIEREKKARPIRIPLFGGLLGYRTAIINRDKLSHFKQISPVQLKQLTACQKSSWPDADILQHNQFKLLRVSQFELMFKMVAHHRCDYFPRAIFETQPEVNLAQRQYPQLIEYDDIILHYPFAMYFFVAKNNQPLAKLLTLGLMRAIQDGSLAKLRQQHPITKALYPLTKWRNKAFIELENPFLPANTPTQDSTLWLTLEPTQK